MTINVSAILLLLTVVAVTMLVFPRKVGFMLLPWSKAGSQPGPLFVRLWAVAMLVVVFYMGFQTGLF